MQRLEQDRCKVVVKNLPPLLPLQELKVAIDEVCSGQYTYFRFVPGKQSLKTVKTARLYLRFRESQYVYQFRAAFDGHTFVNEKGSQLQCFVEYAPSQKVPRKVVKVDPREDTLDKSADYQKFLEELENPTKTTSISKTAAESTVESNANGEKSRKITSLMQYIQAKRSGKVLQDTNSTKSSKSRLRRKKGLEGAPPPGFGPLNATKTPPTLTQAQIEACSAVSKDHCEAAREAVATALKGPEKSAESISGKQATKKRGAKLKGPSGNGKVLEAPAPVVKRLLKKEDRNVSSDLQEQPALPALEEKMKPVQVLSEQASADDSQKAAGKPVKVRAGFQLYTPGQGKQQGRSQKSSSSGASNNERKAGEMTETSLENLKRRGARPVIDRREASAETRRAKAKKPDSMPIMGERGEKDLGLEAGWTGSAEKTVADESWSQISGNALVPIVVPIAEVDTADKGQSGVANDNSKSSNATRGRRYWREAAAEGG